MDLHSAQPHDTVDAQLITALRESEARFRGAFDHAAVGMALTDLDGRWIRVNRALCELLGRTEADLLGHGFEQFSRPDDREPNASLFRRAVAGEIDHYQIEKRYVHEQGHDVWVAVSASMVRDERGTGRYLVAQIQNLSGRKQAEAELQASEARLAHVAANVPGVVYQFVYRPDGSKGFTFVSEAARALLGVTPAAMLQDPAVLFELVHPSDRAQMHASGAAAAAAGGPWRWEGRLILATGEERWVQVASYNRLQPDGGICSDGILMDITELRRTQAALRHRDREFHTLTEHLPDVIARLDRDGRHRHVNAAVTRATGIPPESWIGRTHLEVGVPAVLAARWRDAIDQALDTGQPTQFEFEVPTPAGLRWYEYRLVPEHEAEMVGTVLAIGRDVTTQREAANTLHERAAYFRSLSASSPVGIFHADNAGQLTYANPRLQQIWAATAADMLGFGWQARVHRDDVDAVARGWTAALQASRDFEQEYRLQLPDGSIRWVNGRSAPLRDASGVAIGTVGTIEDITERRTLEAQLRQSQKLEAVGQLAGGIAHDFNNLLTVIRMHGELALAMLDPAQPLHEDLTQINQATTRAASLTRQLLAFSRKQLLQPRPLALGQVVAGLLPMLRRLIGEDIRVVTELAPTLGCVLADPGQLEHVLINLALNARDAMPTGGTLSVATADVVIAGDGSAATSPVPPGAYATLAVGDTGTGMTPEVRERIFEPFFTTKPVGRGSGLGLPTAYGVIQQSGGHIVVDSTPGRGSTFTIYLPRIAKRDAAPPTGEPERRPGRGAETILLVEDEAAVRRLARRILERQGYSVLEAEDGHRALALARAHDGPLDLLITDMVMPGLSGRALAERLTTERRGLRVLFMSGYTDDEIVRRGLTGRHTTIDLLEKPFTADVLLRAARAVLEGRRLQPA